MAQLDDYLKLLIKTDGSDLYLTANAPASIKVHGVLKYVNKEILDEKFVHDLAMSIIDDKKKQQFNELQDVNLALTLEKKGRFRVNIFQQRNQTAVVIRSIKTQIPTVSSLSLPPILEKLILKQRGLILLVGATGSGKSTTLAAMIGYRNRQQSGHILSIEDPIEFVHEHDKSIISQREIGVDSLDYKNALENALRQAPDVILVGEIRSRNVMEYAMTFTETGHLCLSTLHATNTNQAIDRIINFFPQDRHKQLLLDLSLNLNAIISQRLVRTKEGKRIAATEILLNTPLISDHIKNGRIDEIKEIMERSKNLGMHTFDNSLFDLYEAGHITYEETLNNADSANNLRIRIQLAQGVAGDNKELKIQEDKQADWQNNLQGD